MYDILRVLNSCKIAQAKTLQSYLTPKIAAMNDIFAGKNSIYFKVFWDSIIA